jgi:hypothetical protein
MFASIAWNEEIELPESVRLTEQESRQLREKYCAEVISRPLYVTSVLVSDGYFTLKRDAPDALYQYLEISINLPVELQARLAWVAGRKDKEVMTPLHFDHGLSMLFLDDRLAASSWSE